MEISSPSFYIVIDGMQIDSTKIESLLVRTSIYDILPSGYINFRDGNGLEFAKMRWPIGTDISIIVYDLQDNDNKYLLCNMKILKIENPVDSDASSLGGRLRISFGHPWLFYQDFTDRAFGSQPGSDIIFKILDSSKVKKYLRNGETLKDAIKTTDGSDNPPRYKCGESDLSFILSKVIPYSTINQQPAMMFISDSGDLIVNSWLGMYSEPLSKKAVTIVPDMSQTGTEIAEGMKNQAGKGPIIWVNDISFSIGGNGDLASQTFVRFYFDIAKASKTAVADLRPQAAIGATSGKSVTNALPMSALTNIFGDIHTNSYIIKNRNFSDAVSLATNINSNLFDTFSVDITTNFFCGDIMTIGNVAYLAWPNVGDKKEHWVNGKWLITGVTYGLSAVNNTALVTKLHLSRPTFNVPNTDNCCIENFSLLERC